MALQIAALRTEAGMTQTELAKKAGTTQQQISRLESPSYEGHSLFGKTRRALLALLYSHPDASLYLRQLAGMTGVGMGSLQRELKQLNDLRNTTSTKTDFRGFGSTSSLP